MRYPSSLASGGHCRFVFLSRGTVGGRQKRACSSLRWFNRVWSVTATPPNSVSSGYIILMGTNWVGRE